MSIHDHNALSIPRRLEAWVTEYEAKVAAIAAAIAEFEAACKTVRVAACVGGVWGEEVIASHCTPAAKTMERSLRRSAFRHFIAELNLEKVMSAVDKRRVEQMLTDPLPFDLDSLRAVFGDHIANPRDAILRGLAEVFTTLDPAYKSHEKVKIGAKGLPKRIIVSGLNDYGGGWGWDRVRDAINALAAYQNKPLVTGADMAALRADGDALRESKEMLDPYESAHVHRRRAEAGQPPNTIRTVARGVWLKRFQNGNGHLFFGPEALRDINLALAEYYGDVLPDCPDETTPRPAKRASTEVSKDLQYYPTPVSVAQGIVADLSRLEGARVLEPSCGCGRFMDPLRKAGAHVIGCEVDPARVAMCEAKGHRVIRANFLETQPTADFDRVVMNPPFYGKHYEKHIRHALRFLKPGGTLTAILPATARYDHGLLDDLKPSWRDLEAGTFSESGTNICTTVCTIRKATA